MSWNNHRPFRWTRGEIVKSLQFVPILHEKTSILVPPSAKGAAPIPSHGRPPNSPELTTAAGVNSVQCRSARSLPESPAGMAPIFRGSCSMGTSPTRGRLCGPCRSPSRTKRGDDGADRLVAHGFLAQQAGRRDRGRRVSRLLRSRVSQGARVPESARPAQPRLRLAAREARRRRASLSSR